MRFVLLLLMFATPSLVSAQDYGLSLTSGEGDVTDTVEVTVSATVDGDGFSAFQFAVCHDSDLASIFDTDIVLGDLLTTESPAYEATWVEADSWRSVVMVDLLDPTATIDAGGELYLATYTLDAIGTCDRSHLHRNEESNNRFC